MGLIKDVECTWTPVSKDRGLVTALVLATVLSLAARPATALNIIPVFNNAQSDAPAFDPNGTLLSGIFDYAESFYQNAIQDNHTITINFWYDDLATLLGVHSLVSQSGGRETAANIRIDTRASNGTLRNYFFDPTPGNNSEFNMQQTLWRDLSGPQRNDWYNFSGTIPDTFEVGFTGSAVGGGAASGLRDMVSLVLHEVGHSLGMSGSNNSTVSETNDGDYDFDPDFVFNATLAADNVDQPSDFRGHLDNTNALMFPSLGGNGFRKLPSHTDLFSMAAGHNYTSLDVPRREFYGNSNWQNPGNWSGDEVPESGDDVFVRDARGPGIVLTASLNANGLAANLNVSEGANVDTNAFKLDVGGDVTVTGTDTDIFVNPGGELEADEVFIQNSAEIEMSGGTLDVRRVTIAVGTQIQSTSGGSILVDVSQRLVNSGQIDASGNSTITLVSAAANPWDLDGGGDGLVDASGGNINFASGGLSDSFDGIMRVGAGRVLTIAAAWTNSSGTLDLNGGADFANRARLNGGTLTLTGGTIAVTGVAHINAPVVFFGGTNPIVTLGANDILEFNGTTNVVGGTFNVGQGSNINFDGITTLSGGTFNTISTNPTDGDIEFNGATTYSGGTITINGIVRQDGVATVSTDTLVEGGVFDLDGLSGIFSTWTLNKTLTLNVDAIDAGNNVFNGTLNMNNSGIFLINSSPGGRLIANLPGSDEWTLAGTTNLDGSIPSGFLTIIPAMISGSDVNITGTVNMQDRGSIDARMDLTGTITTADAGSQVRLLGGDLVDVNTIANGTISGPGRLTATNGRALHGQGTIGTTIDFDGDTSELMADNGTLNVNGTLLDVGVIGTADTDGVLNVTNLWNTNVATRLELNGGSVIGARITNGSAITTGLIIGHGTVGSAGLLNQGTIAADGGELVIDSSSLAPDLDGTTGAGVLEAINGDLTVVDALSDSFDGTATVGAARNLTFQSGWTLNTSGTLNLDGGLPAGTQRATVTGSTQNLRGTVNVDQETGFFIGTRFLSTVTVNLPDGNDALRMFDASIISAGATFTGNGLLANVSGNTMTLQDGAVIGVQLLNAGTIEIGNSPGEVSADTFSQTPLGKLHVEIQAAKSGQFDVLDVVTEATLAGTLSIDLLGAFMPDYFDEFDILIAGSRSGEFDQINGALIDPDMTLAPVYDYNGDIGLTLIAALPGDANLDGTVNGDDLLAWQANLFSGDEFIQGDFNIDGTVNGDDLLIWQSHLFDTVPLPLLLPATAPIPEPGTAVLLIGLGLLGVTMRRGVA